MFHSSNGLPYSRRPAKARWPTPRAVPAAGLRGKDSSTIIMVMAKISPFALVYADEVKEHLRAVETKYHSLIQSEIEGQLRLSLRWRLAIGSR